MSEEKKTPSAEETETPKKEKKSKKNAELEALKAELNEKTDLLLRTAAELLKPCSLFSTTLFARPSLNREPNNIIRE